MTTAQALASLMSAILKCLKAVGRATAAAVLTKNPSKVWNELGPGFFQAGPAAWLEMSTAAAQLRQDREPSGPHRRWTAKCVEDKIPVSQGNTSEQSSLLSSTILWSSDQL